MTNRIQTPEDRTEALGRVVVRAVENGDPQLKCTECDQVLCTVEDGDLMIVLADTAAEHGDTECVPAADNAPEGALDVWLRFDPQADDDEADAEANVWRDGDRFEVRWYLNAVGQVTAVGFATYAAARKWLTEQGFEDYSA